MGTAVRPAKTFLDPVIRHFLNGLAAFDKALKLRLNRRFRRNLSANLQYVFAKSIDNSSTLGGAGNAVAQNFFNLAAERGLSSFDRRHALALNYVIQSPVGSNGILSNQKVMEKALKDWTLAGSLTLQTGTPLTARVLGNQSDIAGTGTIGSGRAQATGLPVDSGTGFFNLLAMPAGTGGFSLTGAVPNFARTQLVRSGASSFRNMPRYFTDGSP